MNPVLRGQAQRVLRRSRKEELPGFTGFFGPGSDGVTQSDAAKLKKSNAL
jgi:hypothetical protein